MYYHNVIDIDYRLISWGDRIKFAWNDAPKFKLILVYILYLGQAGLL